MLLQLSAKVNIVIPVYNALDKLEACVESIRKHTDFQHVKVVFVDDCSTEQNVVPYLRNLVSQKDFHGVLLENKENLGFSASVNRGIREGGESEDVIILNSDTVVTKNWVEKLQRAAYSAPAIASVTPLSNNATIYSVPVFCESNEIPDGYSIDTYADLIEQASMHLYPQTPVAHGFCMYVRRDVIQAVGYLDSQTFGRGYGEENDFCFRAEQLGFKHIMCDDTYIYHNETASFKTEEKKKLIQAHEKILLERYPEQMKKNAEYIRSNPHQYVRDNIRMHQMLPQERQSILYILHSDFREDAANNIGGTQFHVKDLMLGLKQKYNIFIASRDGAYLRVTAYTEADRLSFKFYIGEPNRYYHFHDQKLRKLFDTILKCFRIDLVHVHHPGSLSFDIFDVAEDQGIPIVTTLHDFYYVCPNVKLLEKGKHYCGGNCENCNDCIKDQFGIAIQTNYKSYWQDQCKSALQKSQMLITPSVSAKELYEALIPEMGGKIKVIPHGMDRTDSEQNPNLHETEAHNTKAEKRIAFIGWLNEAKGSRLACRMIEASDDRYHWYVIGGIADADLFALEKKNLTKIDRYTREKASDILEENRIDLVCILPIWPETFCYTLSEAVIAGIPVLTTDIGAMGERMQESGFGWTIPYGSSPEQILKKIDDIFADPDKYAEIKEHLKQYHHKSVAEMDAEYDSLYRELLERTGSQPEKKEDDEHEYKRIIYEAYASCPDSQAQSIGNDADLQERVDTLETKLRNIQGSVEYKVVRQLSGMNLPFRRQIIGILRKAWTIYRKDT